MFISMFLVKIIINDVLLLCMKKASDRYSSSKCRSSCCDGVLNWNYKANRTPHQTMESIQSH